MNRSVVCLMTLAGLAISSTAVAQGLPQAQDVVLETRRINLDGSPASAFGERALASVYDNWSCAGAAVMSFVTGTVQPKVFVDDISCNPGPWAATTQNEIREFSILIRNPGTTARNFFLTVLFFDESVDFANPGQLIPAGAAVTGFNANLTQGANSFLEWVIALPAGQFLLPDSDCKIVAFLSTDGTFANRLPLADPLAFGVSGRNTTSPGTSDVISGWDFDGDGDVEVSADVDQDDRFAVNAAGICGDLRPAFKIKGEVLPTPPSFTQISPSPIGDGLTSVSFTPDAGGVKWYRFSLGGAGANDAAATFLDIDTEGSIATDTVVALYDANGNLVGNPDDNDGSGNLSQLTYGVGRRTPTGDGRQYDGRDSELAPGDYFIGVAAAPATFSGAFLASSSSTETADIQVRINSNSQGTPAAEAVPPIPNFDLGAINVLTPVGEPAPAIQPGDVLWFKFDVCEETSLSNFIDVDFSRCGEGVDPVAHIFDASGNLVTSDDDSGAEFLPQLSFGGNTARPAYSGAPEDPAFNGESGNIAPGTYYMSLAHFPVTPQGTRWQVRSGDAITNIGLIADFYSSITNTSCGGPECAWASDGCFADYDNSGGIDGDDVIAFFGDWDANGLCADADTSGGVDGDDVIAFFASWDANGTGQPGC